MPGVVARWLARTALWGAVAGAIVYLVIFGATLDARGALWTTAIGIAYAIMMRGAQELVAHGLERRLPLRTRRDVLARVLALGAATLVSLAAATRIIELVSGFRLFGNLSTFLLIAIVAVGASIIGNGYVYLELFHARLERAEQAAVRAELGVLRAQINPHFLFNSLNSIAALVRIAPAQAERVIESLADLFRYSLRASAQPAVTLGEEVDALELYTTIEQARFGDRLSIVIDVPERLRDIRAVSLLLQPLVENAIKHGLSRIEGPFTISIVAREVDDRVEIVVADSGPGFRVADIDTLSTAGHGLSNIRERLRLELGAGATMRLERGAVCVRLPMERREPTNKLLTDDPLHHRR